ncbi:response regulator [Siculibacillus lacustris]|nr:response regulator [Siculibacillus lacustris]
MPVLSALIVDDSVTVRNHLRVAIANIIRDCQVFEAEGALEAARFLSKFIPEVVFLDLNMPKVSGIAFLDKLDAIMCGRKPPIIVSISSDLSDSTLSKLEARGTYDVLPKPFDPQKVAAVLLRVMQMSRSRRVLVVDDSATVRTLVRKIIEKSRFNLTVEEAATGGAAIAAFRGQVYDVAFIDLNMPGIDGLEAAGEILYSRADTHVVLMSGQSDEGVRRAASHIGVEFFLKKPFYPSDVDAVLHAFYDMSDARFLEVAEREVFAGDFVEEMASVVPAATFIDLQTPL